MKKEDLTAANMICEAIGAVSAFIYIGLQIYCGILYGVGSFTILTNVAMVLLVYAGLTMLSGCPEKVNRLEPQVCTGRIRHLTIHMLLYIKLVFTLCLLFTSVCDVRGIEIDGGYSLISTGLIVLLAIGYEIKIFQILKSE